MTRKRKSFSPGTFIPTPQRILAILQLCFAFSLILWYAVQPFMGEYFALKSQMLMYEYVMGTSTILKSDEQKDKLMRNQERFLALPSQEKEVISGDYQQLYQYSTRSIFQKMLGGLRALLVDIPPFELAWIVFSSILSIAILLKKEGARPAAWLLPLIVLAYGTDNQLNGQPTILSPDVALIPTEHQLQPYVNEPLSSRPKELQDQLKRGWEAYLISHWSSPNAGNHQEQLEVAEFNFTMARLKALHQVRRFLFSSQEKSHPFWLLLYVIWNCFFAWQMNKSRCQQSIADEKAAKTSF